MNTLCPHCKQPMTATLSKATVDIDEHGIPYAYGVTTEPLCAFDPCRVKRARAAYRPHPDTLAGQC